MPATNSRLLINKMWAAAIHLYTAQAGERALQETSARVKHSTYLYCPWKQAIALGKKNISRHINAVFVCFLTINATSNEETEVHFY